MVRVRVLFKKTFPANKWGKNKLYWNPQGNNWSRHRLSTATETIGWKLTGSFIIDQADNTCKYWSILIVQKRDKQTLCVLYDVNRKYTTLSIKCFCQQITHHLMKSLEFTTSQENRGSRNMINWYYRNAVNKIIRNQNIVNSTGLMTQFLSTNKLQGSNYRFGDSRNTLESDSWFKYTYYKS